MGRSRQKKKEEKKRGAVPQVDPCGDLLRFRRVSNMACPSKKVQSGHNVNKSLTSVQMGNRGARSFPGEAACKGASNGQKKKYKQKK